MSTGTSPSLRERRKRETRDEIRRGALALVRERGYDSVTVDLISERAGVSVRTFFNYFASKESALIAVPPLLPEHAVRAFLSRTGSDGLFADLAELTVSMFENDGADPSGFQSSIQIVMSVPALATLQHGALAERDAEFTTLIAERLGVDSTADLPAVIVAALTGAIGVACRRWADDPDGQAFPERVRACLMILSTV